MVSYDEFSNLLGNCPELVIVRRFGPLAAQVILRMQAELLELDDDLKVLKKVEQRHPDRRGQAQSWEKVNEDINSGGRSCRKEIVLQAEEKLTRYYQFLMCMGAVMKLGSPDPCDVEFLRTWLQSEQGGNDFLRNSASVEATAWDTAHTGDLVALIRRSDRFAAWVANNLMPSYHKWLGYRFQTKIVDNSLGSFYAYDDKRLVILGNVLCTILSTMIPSSSILILYYVRNMLSRLLLIIAFSSLFSLVMGFVAQAKRYEIFAATIGFAAVQVVFVGGVSFNGDN